MARFTPLCSIVILSVIVFDAMASRDEGNLGGQLHLQASSSANESEDGEALSGGIQFGHGVKELSVRWSQNTWFVTFGEFSPISHIWRVTFTIGKFRDKREVREDKKIRQLNHFFGVDECLSECKITDGSWCNGAGSSLNPMHTERSYVAGAAHYSNHLHITDFKLCCAVKDCDEGTWQDNVDIAESAVDRRGGGQCLCCDDGLTCDNEQLSDVPESDCVTYQNLKKWEELEGHCVAVFQAKRGLKLPPPSRSHIDDHVSEAQVWLGQGTWWEHCKETCAASDRKIAKAGGS